MSRPLRVLVVDDSAVVRETLTRLLGDRHGMTVSVAPDPVFALAKLQGVRADVIVLDLEMPRMDGITFMRRIAAMPVPIPVVVCSAHAGEGSEAAMEALALGAVEIVAKPKLGVRDFLADSEVVIADAVRAAAASRPRAQSDRSEAPLRWRPGRADGGRIVAIGASTGGTEAIAAIVSRLPPDAPGIAVVQHMPEGFTKAFARRLATMCAMSVHEASTGARLRNGIVLIAPGNRHLRIVADAAGYAAVVEDGPLVSRHRPSVDVLFESVARAAGINAVGVILTGMGADGAAGISALHRAGAETIAQDEESCAVFGMPKEAIATGHVGRVVSLRELPRVLLEAAASVSPSRA